MLLDGTMAFDEALRPQLVALARRKRSRRAGGQTGLPCRWNPWEVRDPSSHEFFTEPGAWEFIAAKLESGCTVEVIQLKRPPGRTGYVLLIPMPSGRDLYVKLQLGSGVVLGRSFHISTKQDDDDEG